jgi:cytidine deaminase
MDLSVKKLNVLSYGSNYYLPQTDKTVHAEHDVIDKLPYFTRQRKLREVNILVIRVTKNNKLSMSRPCKACILLMQKFPIHKGYTIKNVFYSDDKGCIIKIKLSKLAL